MTFLTIKKIITVLCCSLMLSGTVVVGAAQTGTPTRFFSGVFALYADNRKQDIGNYITPDLAIISYSLIKNNLLKQQEKSRMAPNFRALVRTLYQQNSQHQKTRLQNTDKTGDAPESIIVEQDVWSANQDFLSILLKLIEPETEIVLSETAQKELKLIHEAKGLSVSPLWQYPLDYSQMKVRGHYSQSEEMGRYFQSMRYANTVLMPFVSSKATQVTPKLKERFISQAMQLSELLHAEQSLLTKYQQLNQYLDWAVGPKEDFDMLSFRSAAQHCQAVKEVSLSTCLIDFAKQQALVPKILGQALDVSQLSADEKPEELLIGFRLFPSRYTIDSDLMQNTVYKKPGMLIYEGDPAKRPFSLSNINGEAVKGYPLLDELMQLSNSEAAKNRLDQQQDSQYKDYVLYQQKNKQILKKYLTQADLGRAEWHFMHSVFSAEQHSETLTLMRAFWTWRRYQQQLYAKQSYTPNYKSMPPPESRTKADLQVATGLYNALVELISVHIQQSNEKKWQWFLQDVKMLATLSKKRETDELSKEDMLYLNELDRRLKALVKDNDLPIVVDVHTNAADKMVLQEATGPALVITLEQGAQSLRGARLTQCEFKQPVSARLTDERWRKAIAVQNIDCHFIVKNK